MRKKANQKLLALRCKKNNPPSWLPIVAVEQLSPTMTKDVPPLGGSEFIQLAVLLLLGVAAEEFLARRRKRK
jgi:hypothetical protein